MPSIIPSHRPIYMPSIIPSHRSIARTRQNRRHLRQGVRYRLVRPVAQVWAPPATAQERRAPTIRAALRPTGSGPAQTLLLSYVVAVGRAQTRPCRGAATEGVPARKPMSAAYRQENQKAYFWSTGRGNGVTGVHRAFSDGYQGESIELLLGGEGGSFWSFCSGGGVTQGRKPCIARPEADRCLRGNRSARRAARADCP